MSRQQNSPITIIAGEALAAFRNVKVDGTYADAGYAGIGITQAAAANGSPVMVRPHNHGGTCKITAAGAFSAQATLYSAADGTFDDSVVGSPMYYALEAATATGDIVEAIACKGETDSSALANSGISARSRAATAMPTAAIWKHFNLPGLRSHAFSGSLLEVDFTKTGDAPFGTFNDTTAIQYFLSGAGGIGEYVLMTSADNEEAAAQWSVPIIASGGGQWAFECRMKVENITNNRASVFAGLILPTNDKGILLGDVIADDGDALSDLSYIGFFGDHADADGLDCMYRKAGQTAQTVKADNVLAANTYLTVGLYYDGTTIAVYVNGVALTEAVSAANIAAGTFPAGLVLAPTFAVKGDHADDFDFTIDWIRAAQQPS